MAILKESLHHSEPPVFICKGENVTVCKAPYPWPDFIVLDPSSRNLSFLPPWMTCLELGTVKETFFGIQILLILAVARTDFLTKMTGRCSF